MELSNDDRLAIAAGLLELGHENSVQEFNDIKNCPGNCGYRYFVNALGRTKLIKCPHCGTVRER